MGHRISQIKFFIDLEFYIVRKEVVRIFEINTKFKFVLLSLQAVQN